MTNDRLRRLASRLAVDRYPLCIERLKIVFDVLERTAGQPQIWRRAQCLAEVLARLPIFIEPDELIVGQGASQPMGLEIDAEYGEWSPHEIALLKDDGFAMSPEDEAALQALYRRHSPQTLVGAVGEIVGDDPELWPFLRSGIVLPPWKDRREGSGGGYAQSGLGLGPGFYLMGIDFVRVIDHGLNHVVEEAVTELAAERTAPAPDAAKLRYLESVILMLRALVGFSGRYAELADALARREPDPTRRRELEQIAAACRHVPAHPARTFREALQAFWFVFLAINPSPTAAAGRFDQYMYPLYRQDVDAGRLMRDEAVELLACLRIKDMQLNRVSGALNRKKNAGLAKWHNWTLGGQTRDGRDASNELSYLLLDAALAMPVPHHTLTLRVHAGTPDDLMLKALEVVRTGLGLPAFVGDDSYIRYFMRHGVPLEEARDYLITGCLDANLPGRSRTSAIGMFIVPLVLDIFLHDGVDPNTGLQVGPPVGDLGRFDDFDSLLAAFERYLAGFMALAARKNDIELSVLRDLFQDPLRSSLMDGGIAVGRDVLDREMPFENGAVLNPVGMVNVADSFAAIRRVVFEERRCTLGQLKAALDADWQDHGALHAACLAAPKFGNGDPAVDALAARLYRFWAETTESLGTLYGAPHKPTAISITSHQPGGALTGATPDGRRAHEILADGTVSPMQGADTRGPTRILGSAMAIDQDPYQATLLNMKLHPSALRTEADLRKLASLIRTYFAEGGKHVQFNVVDRATLLDAQRSPEKHRNLAVRVAGYSAYFVQLGKDMQDEVIRRTEHGAV